MANRELDTFDAVPGPVAAVAAVARIGSVIAAAVPAPGVIVAASTPVVVIPPVPVTPPATLPAVIEPLFILTARWLGPLRTR